MRYINLHFTYLLEGAAAKTTQTEQNTLTATSALIVTFSLCLISI